MYKIVCCMVLQYILSILLYVNIPNVCKFTGFISICCDLEDSKQFKRFNFVSL